MGDGVQGLGFTVSLISFGESVIWRQPHDLFRVAETGGGII